MPHTTGSELTKYSVALLVALGGMTIAAIVVCVLAFKGMTAGEITAIAGVFTTLIGTLVGTFLGVQVAGAGKQRSADLAHRALAALPPEKAEALVKESIDAA